MHSQPGIFALGTTDHCYLEFDLPRAAPDAARGVLAAAVGLVGFSEDQWRMAEMLRRMAGVADGVRCALTRYVTPLTGAFYVVPSVEALAGFAPAEGD